MDSNKRQGKIAEERFTRAREFFRFKAITRNLVQETLMTLEKMSAEEMHREKSSQSRIEKYYLLHHYLDYLKQFCEGEI